MADRGHSSGGRVKLGFFWKRNVFAVVGGSSVYGVEMEDVGRSWRARKHRSS